MTNYECWQMENCGNIIEESNGQDKRTASEKMQDWAENEAAIRELETPNN